MNWGKARRLIRGRCDELERRPGEPIALARARSLCVASGKGGTGKSVLSASLAALFAERGATLLVDGDLGVGNAHILQDVSPVYSFADVVSGARSVAQIVTPCRGDLDLLAGGSGYAGLAALSSYELRMIAGGIEALESDYEHLVVDSAAGISEQTVSLAAAADVVLLVTTPDATAMTDAYAFLKVLLQRRPTARPLLVVNRTTSLAEATDAAKRLAEVSEKFLGRMPRWIGSLPEDRCAGRSVRRRQPVVLEAPDSALAVALRELESELVVELEREPPRGLGRRLLDARSKSGRQNDKQR